MIPVALLLIFLLFIFSLLIFSLLALKVYGVIVGFSIKWYVGVLTLIVPFFAEILGGYKLITKKNLFTIGESK